MVKMPTFSVHGSKPAYSFPMLILLLRNNSIIHESLCIASVGQNIIVYAKNTYFQFSSWQQTCTLFSHVNHMEDRQTPLFMDRMLMKLSPSFILSKYAKNNLL
jgi:hypothetical protein